MTVITLSSEAGTVSAHHDIKFAIRNKPGNHAAQSRSLSANFFLVNSSGGFDKSDCGKHWNASEVSASGCVSLLCLALTRKCGPEARDSKVGQGRD
ncbi:hypothetical protein [Hoeflea sp.]|uniref:hypothetical protein n=1 Tax=Hoeflea sp. TaxID=1940281 RepID=UPI0032EEC40D